MALKLLFLLLLTFLVTNGNVTDQELDDAFNELERQLNYKQEVKDLIKEIKDEVTKKPDITARTLGMAKALNLAVPKFQTGRSVDVSVIFCYFLIVSGDYMGRCCHFATYCRSVPGTGTDWNNRRVSR